MNAARGESARGDFVQLIEVDGHAPSTVAGPDEQMLRTASRQRWRWWRGAAGRARVVVVLALAGAVGATVAAATAHHRTAQTVRTVTAPVPVGGSDALSCPVRSSCVVRASAAVAAARGDSFPDATGFDVIDTAHPGKPIARYLTAGRGANHLRVVSTCDARRRPAAVDEPPRRGSTVAHRLRISAGSADADTAVATDWYSRHDTFGCTVEVTCTYSVPVSPPAVDTLVDRCSVYVDRLGMDVRVYL